MIGTDKAARWSTAAAVISVAVVAAMVSYEHAYALIHARDRFEIGRAVDEIDVMTELIPTRPR